MAALIPSGDKQTFPTEILRGGTEPVRCMDIGATVRDQGIITGTGCGTTHTRAGVFLITPPAPVIPLG
jgi:hypothetical protein